MTKQAVSVLAIILMLSLASATCWDRVELEDVAWVQIMGFDKGVDGLLATTIQVGIPHSLRGAISAGGSGNHPEYLTMTVHSKTALEALDLASVNLGRRVSLVHAQAFVFGEALARGDIRGLAGAMDRYREIRGTTLVAVAKGRADDLLRLMSSPLEVSPSRFVQTLLQQHTHTGLFKSSSFVRDFVNLMESSSKAPLVPLLGIAADVKPPSKGEQGDKENSTPADLYPSTPKEGERLKSRNVPAPLSDEKGSALAGEAGAVPKIGGSPVVMLGAAVFCGGKMVGTLSGEEARALLAVQNDLDRCSYAVPDPQYPNDIQYSLGFTVHKGRSKIETVRDGDSVKISVRLNIEASYLSPKTATDYTDPRRTDVAERALAGFVKKSLDSAIYRTQKEMRIDPFGFGNKVKHTFATWPAFEAFEWQNKYPDAEIVTEVKAKVRRYGLDLGPLQIPQWEKTRAAEAR